MMMVLWTVARDGPPSYKKGDATHIASPVSSQQEQSAIHEPFRHQDPMQPHVEARQSRERFRYKPRLSEFQNRYDRIANQLLLALATLAIFRFIYLFADQ
ncbi:hypothetical protein BG60_00985 [Caballeronia zhejiangensis]|uniref:Uncharacterized protein n=1 Tax=Caballeronia zhejiangensis TaxID=871203 RepID=A0A656QUI0_9BURK|nr:hypothetical protein BURK_012418 [Burkholderia sp. SJ98]KDR34253.1 hypothetical protein BG60_00985 [Caballeronia zhejiangensis]